MPQPAGLELSMLRDLLAASERGEISPETLNRFLSPQEAALTADFTPVVGDVKALAYDLPQNLQKGDYGWAAVDALSALPVVGMLGDAAKAARKAKRAADTADVSKFIDDLYTEFPEFPYRENAFFIPLEQKPSGEVTDFAEFVILPDDSMNPRTIYVDWVSAAPQRTGNGTKAMKELIKRAEAANLNIRLQPYDKGRTSKAALNKFYKKLGFEKGSGDSLIYKSGK